MLTLVCTVCTGSAMSATAQGGSLGCPPLGATLFVVTAHLPNAVNCALLQRTLRSIRCYHPTDPILVVDNASPFRGNVGSAAASFENVLIVRQAHSFGQLGAWRVADELFLNLTRSSNAEALDAMPLPFTRQPIHSIAVLQHSTRLAGPLSFIPGCRVVSLGGHARWYMPTDDEQQDMSSNAHPINVYNVTPTTLQFASTVAREASIECIAPCSYPNGTARLHGIHWEPVWHSAAIFSRSGWEDLARLGLWPRNHLTSLAPPEKLSTKRPQTLLQAWWSSGHGAGPILGGVVEYINGTHYR